jgi:hypothetical protein
MKLTKQANAPIVVAPKEMTGLEDWGRTTPLLQDGNDDDDPVLNRLWQDFCPQSDFQDDDDFQVGAYTREDATAAIDVQEHLRVCQFSMREGKGYPYVDITFPFNFLLSRQC